VSNSDTHGYRPRDLAPLQFDRTMPTLTSIGLDRTDAGHIASSNASSSQASRLGGYDVRPTGIAVNLEDEMIKVAANQMDYQAATTLYTKSLGLIKIAIGKR
jgi:flagellar basal-body rod protein FlgB